MDGGSNVIHDALEDFQGQTKLRFHMSQILAKYHELMMNCYFVFGNSSSGILEAG